MHTAHSSRDMYATQNPHLALSRSPSISSHAHNRGVPLSPSSSGGFASGSNSKDNVSGSPPMPKQEVYHTLQTSDGQEVCPEIHSKIEKGFFMSEPTDTEPARWTCYRRNYFQIACSYMLKPMVPVHNLRILKDGQWHPVHDIAVNISASIEDQGGANIPLVQHTPKRDKGPQTEPSRISLAPRSSPPNHSSSSSDANLVVYNTRNAYDQSQPLTDYTYERIQFKNATQNNGRRRAAQQFYHLYVELWVDLGDDIPTAQRWVKIAQRMSDQIVVRGRSPGHYRAELRNRGGSEEEQLRGQMAYSNQTQEMVQRSMGMMQQLPVSQGYGSHPSHYGISTYQDTRAQQAQQQAIAAQQAVAQQAHAQAYHQYSKDNVTVPIEPMMTVEDIKSIESSPGYLYYPSPLYEGTAATGLAVNQIIAAGTNRPQLPMPTIKREMGAPPQQQQSQDHHMMVQHQTHSQHHGGHSGFSGLSLPSLTANVPADSMGIRHLNRFEGVPSSRGHYYPTAQMFAGGVGELAGNM